MHRVWVSLLILGAVFLASLARAAEIERVPIGAKVGPLAFKDIRYLTRTLDEFGARKAFVIVATTNSCPIAKRYGPVLASLEKEYRERGVQFIGLNVGANDPIVEIAAEAVEAKVAFPVVKDIEGQCARALGLSRTPEAVVLDANTVIRYRGRIDDQFRLGGDRPTAKASPLRDAIEDVLASRDVVVRETTVDGCLITAAEPSKARPEAPPTFTEHVSRIMQAHCQDCHHSGAEAPFPLVSYRDVAAEAAMIAEVVEDRRMPPWYASERHGTFINHRGLSDQERDTVLQWVRAGKPKGDPAKLPAPRAFSTGTWTIGAPDTITTTPIAYSLPETGYLDYRHAILPHIFAQDTWVQSVEILPDNPRVVHHANLAFIKAGERPREENFITGRVPGGDPMVLDDGLAVLIPKGSVLALQIHFTTTGKPERAKLSVGLKYPRGVVHKRLYHQQVHTTRFRIPAQAPAHPVTATRPLDFDATGVGYFSHMHLRGKDMTFLAKHPDGAIDTLLLVPNYHFDWQHSYHLPPGTKKFPKGTTFEVTAHYDNSEFNPYNPDPTVAVGVGDQTFNEMMYGFYFYTRDDEDLNLRVDPKTGVAVDGK